jgi:hypothetical protein
MHPRAARALAAVAAAGALLATPLTGRADEPFRLMSAAEAAPLVGAPGVQFMDANPRDVYEEARVPGATFVRKPLAEVLPQDKGTRLIFYCRNPK